MERGRDQREGVGGGWGIGFGRRLGAIPWERRGSDKRVLAGNGGCGVRWASGATAASPGCRGVVGRCDRRGGARRRAIGAGHSVDLTSGGCIGRVDS